jgi:TerB-like protein
MVAVLDTIAAASIGLLMVAYGVGLPVTLIVSGVYWRTRTRPAPAAIPVTRSAPGGPLTAPAFAPSPMGPALLRLSNLERQVLALREAPAPADAYPRLGAEAGELLARYGTESAVGRHATGLLAIIEGLAPAGFGLGDALPLPPLPPPRLPDRLRVGLGRFASAGEPVPVAWAFCWLGHLPDRWPPQVPGHELARAFAARYSEAYPLGGMTLPWTGHRLALRYTPAAARFGGQELVVSTGLPDVAGLPDALHQLRVLGAAAVRDLFQNR